MITPAYSPTATERVLPRMALDFTTGTLDPRVTVARALNTATCVTSTGVIAIVNANLPRFDYDPATLAPKGLLIEEARTNVLLYSEQFNDVTWVKTGSSVDANALVSPDGTTNADFLKEDSATSVHRIEQNVVAASAVTYTYTVYYKITDATRKIALHHTPSNTGRVFSANGGQEAGLFNTPLSFSVTAFNNGWYRASISVTGSVGNNSFRVWLVRASDNAVNYPGNGTSGAYLYGADAEAGAFATSYIPTTTTSLTRNADVVSMTGTNFSSWYNASEGAIYAEGNTVDNVGFPALVTIGRADFSVNYMSILHLSASSTVYAEGYVAGAIQFALSTTGNAKPATNKSVMAYKANSFALSTNGGTVQTDVAGTIPTVDELKIGRLNGNNNYLNGCIRKLSYWPQRIINAETQAFSK